MADGGRRTEAAAKIACALPEADHRGRAMRAGKFTRLVVVACPCLSSERWVRGHFQAGAQSKLFLDTSRQGREVLVWLAMANNVGGEKVRAS